LAEITVKINVGDGVNLSNLQQWILDAVALDIQAPFGGMGHLMDQVTSLVDEIGGLSRQPATQSTRMADPRGPDDSNEIDRDDFGDQETGESEEPPAASSMDSAAPKRKTGRKSNAQKAAEREAAEAAARGEATLAASVTSNAPAAANGSGPALPPGITLPGAALPSPEPARPAPPAAAMPKVPPADPAYANGVMSLEEFRAANLQLQKDYPSKPNLFYRRPMWLDGTPKEPWYTVVQIPEEFRARLLTEVAEWCEAGCP
jgi:hypothetical protein